jgi:hypothetical protein
MFQESFINAAAFVHNMFIDPQTFSAANEDITMLSDALSFNEHGVPESYLNQISETLIIYAGPRETLIKELELLDDDLTTISL